MKTKTLIILLFGSSLFIVGTFFPTSLSHLINSDSLQGFGIGALIGGLMTFFAEWKEKRAVQNTTHQESE